MEYYIVVEVQVSEGNAPAILTFTFTDVNLAYQKYHTILSFAAVSQVPYHGAYILGGTKDREIFEEKFFEHAEKE